MSQKELEEVSGTSGETYHDAKAQAERAGEKDVAFLNAKVGLAWQHANEDIDANDAGSEDTGCARGVSTRVRLW